MLLHLNCTSTYLIIFSVLKNEFSDFSLVFLRLIEKSFHLQLKKQT